MRWEAMARGGGSCTDSLPGIKQHENIVRVRVVLMGQEQEASLGLLCAK